MSQKNTIFKDKSFFYLFKNLVVMGLFFLFCGNASAVCPDNVRGKDCGSSAALGLIYGNYYGAADDNKCYGNKCKYNECYNAPDDRCWCVLKDDVSCDCDPGIEARCAQLMDSVVYDTSGNKAGYLIISASYHPDQCLCREWWSVYCDSGYYGGYYGYSDLVSGPLNQICKPCPSDSIFTNPQSGSASYITGCSVEGPLSDSTGIFGFFDGIDPIECWYKE